MAQEGSIVAALIGMAFVMVGLFQYFLVSTKSSNEDYKKLLGEMELVRKENVQLKVNNMLWKNKYLLLEQQSKDKLDNCYETIQNYLDKTTPLPELRSIEIDEEN